MKKEMPECSLLLGWLARRDGKLKEAYDYFVQALKYRSDYVEAHYWLGRLSLDVRDGNRCRKELHTALKLDPSFAPAHSLQGDLLMALPDKSKWNEALAAYEEAARLMRPDDEDLPKVKERVETLRTYIEFHSHQGEYERPRPLNTPRPNYTGAGRQAHIHGTVKVALLVDEVGRVASARVLSSLGFGLDEEALEAARQVRFSPAKKDGAPAPFWLVIEVDFNLQ